MTNRQVAEQVGALARQIGRMDKRLEEVDQRLTAQLGEVLQALQGQNERLARVERVVAKLELDLNIVKHSTVPEGLRPASIRRSIQKPTIGS